MSHPSQPSLSRSILWVALLVLAFFVLGMVVSLAVLKNMSDKSETIRRQLLPELVDVQSKALKAENIRSYVDALYWAQDAVRERQLRLELQVLIQSFSFAGDPYLVEQADGLLQSVRELIELRSEQRRLLAELRTSLPQLPMELASLLGTPVYNWRPPTLSAEADIQHLLLHMGELNQRADAGLQRLHQYQRLMAERLSTDTALKTQLLTSDIRAGIDLIGMFVLLLLLGVVVALLLLLSAFRALVLKPVQQLSDGLKELGNAQGPSPSLPAMYFSELDNIRITLEAYGRQSRVLHEANVELQRLSQQDPLTGLANRRQFDDGLEQEVRRAWRHRHPLALLMVDIDYFKQLNDRYGHALGDKCLVALAHLLQQMTRRPGELAARYGGEEFMLILPELSLEETWRVAEGIRRECQQLALATGADAEAAVRFTVSIGIAYAAEGERVEALQLFNRADQAMYLAKSSGRNCVCES